MVFPIMISSIYMTMGAAGGLLALVALGSLFMMAPTATKASLLFFLLRSKNKTLIRQPSNYIPMVLFACLALMPLMLQDKRAVFLTYQKPNLSVFIAVVYLGFVLLLIGLKTNITKLFVIGLLFATCSIPPYLSFFSVPSLFGYDFGTVMESKDSWKWIIYEVSIIALCCNALFSKKSIHGIISIIAAFAFIGVSAYCQRNGAVGKVGNNYLSAGVWCLAIVVTNIMLLCFHSAIQPGEDYEDFGETFGQFIWDTLGKSAFLGVILIVLAVWPIIRSGNILIHDRFEFAGMLRKAIAIIIGIVLLLRANGKTISSDLFKKRHAKVVGNSVTFGAYIQDSESSCKSSIEWMILTKDGNKALLISCYALDYVPYNSKLENVTWETCTLRTWLNETFLNNAFSKKEQKAILKITVDNGKSQGDSKWSTSGGNNTEDKIFLLSSAEAEKYFSTDNERICKPTAFANAKKKRERVNDTCSWWLRSPGGAQFFAARVTLDGSPSGCQAYVHDINAVRPACWVDLDSEIFDLSKAG